MEAGRSASLPAAPSGPSRDPRLNTLQVEAPPAQPYPSTLFAAAATETFVPYDPATSVIDTPPDSPGPVPLSSRKVREYCGDLFVSRDDPPSRRQVQGSFWCGAPALGRAPLLSYRIQTEWGLAVNCMCLFGPKLPGHYIQNNNPCSDAAA